MSTPRPARGPLPALAGTLLLLTGCGATCESVHDEIAAIAREIQRDPETAWDRAGELDALRSQLEEMGCLRAP